MFENLLEKTKIVKEIKQAEREKREKSKVQDNTGSSSTDSNSFPIKRAKEGRPQ